MFVEREYPDSNSLKIGQSAAKYLSDKIKVQRLSKEISMYILSRVGPSGGYKIP